MFTLSEAVVTFRFSILLLLYERALKDIDEKKKNLYSRLTGWIFRSIGFHFSQIFSTRYTIR